MDWGVDGPEGEEDIYQTPTLLTARGGPTSARSVSPGAMLKRSDTTGNIDDGKMV